MSLVQTEITLKNANDLMAVRSGYIKETEVRQITVPALVDTGAWTLVINESTREKLGLELLGTESGTLADGTEAEDILLGAIPLEAMDLTVNPRRELVGVHGDQIMHSIK